MQRTNFSCLYFLKISLTKFTFPFIEGQLCGRLKAFNSDEPSLVDHLRLLLHLCHLPCERVLHHVAEGARDHHPEERGQARH